MELIQQMAVFYKVNAELLQTQPCMQRGRAAPVCELILPPHVSVSFYVAPGLPHGSALSEVSLPTMPVAHGKP